MTEPKIKLNDFSKPSLNHLIPSFMRNANIMYQIKLKIDEINWKYEGELLLSKKYLNKEDKRIAKLLILKGVPEDKRGELWFLSSGAKNEMLDNPGYYDFLLNKYPKDIDLNHYHQIDLDIKRTFPEDSFFQNSLVLKKLRNILICYARRNISIGYVQGFNFIVGRLLKIGLDEEQVFWIFVQIIENLLPLNFYSEMAGLMIDIDILMCLFQAYYPDLISYMEENFFIEYFKNLLFQWFISLYIQNFSYEASLALWDILFLESSLVLFKTIIGLLKLVKDDIMKIDSLEHFKNKIKFFFNSFNDISYLNNLLLLRRFEFNLEMIDKNRRILEIPIVERINMINVYKIKKLKENIKITNSECYEEWPICIYDSDSPYKVVNYFVFKTMSSPIFYENYLVDISLNKKLKKKICLDFDKALLERRNHHCGKMMKKKPSKQTDLITTDDDSNYLSTDDKSEKEKYDIECHSNDYSKDDIELFNSGSKQKNKFKHAKCISTITYGQLLKSNFGNNDFNSFISDINARYNQMTQSKVYSLENIEMKKKDKSSDISFELN